MISVDNFYWIISELLLLPSKLSSLHYYPLGTTQELRTTWGHPYQRHQPHVLFYEQEPILEDSLGSPYQALYSNYTAKSCKILANSEHSEIKTKICRERFMYDWYFFYHGFAALEWFRNARYVIDTNPPSKVFLSLNHLVRQKRSYRMTMIANLLSLGMDKFGDVSFHGKQQDCLDEINDERTELSVSSRMTIEKNLVHRENLPITIGSDHINGDYSAHFGANEMTLWKNSYWHVVTETVFYDKKLHLTEKVFKPIISMRPFLLVAAPGNLKYLKSYGFKTFDDWIDESYDDIQDDDQRLNMILQQLQMLCNQNSVKLQAMHDDMRPILEYNHRHFFSGFRTQIVNELVDNFDLCIRRWNNGRVDDRELPLHPDLDRIKKILLS